MKKTSYLLQNKMSFFMQKNERRFPMNRTVIKKNGTPTLPVWNNWVSVYKTKIPFLHIRCPCADFFPR